MAQVKIFGLREHLATYRQQLSDAIHSSLVEAFALPPDKKFQRFFPMEKSDFIFPGDRSERYVIIEVLCFEGRSPEAKALFYRLLTSRLEKLTGAAPIDVEITIQESPLHNWCIRGMPGHELRLSYNVSV